MSEINPVHNSPIKKKRKIWRWIILGYAVVMVILICVAIFYNPKPPELPDEFKQNVTNIITKTNDRFTVNSIELLNSGTIQIIVYLDETPKAENFISLNVTNFIDKIEKGYNYELDLAILVAQPIHGTDKVRYYGRGSFYKDIGKIEYEPAE